jgi:hypothetical protein
LSAYIFHISSRLLLVSSYGLLAGTLTGTIMTILMHLSRLGHVRGHPVIADRFTFSGLRH